MPKAVPKYVRPYAIKQAVIPQNEGGIGEKKLDDDNGKEEYENNDDGDDAAAPTADNDDDADEMMKILADHADFSTQKVRMQCSLGILFPRYTIFFSLQVK